MKLILSLVVMSALAACGPGSGSSPQDMDAAAVDGNPGDDNGNAGDPDAAPRPDAQPIPDNAFVYAHTASTLYRVDPDTLAIEEVGEFQGAVNVTDIALDKDGNMFAVAFASIYRIDPDTAQATHLSTADISLNSLSFVPDPDNPSVEILVAADNDDGTVLAIDPTSGDTDEIGSYGPGLVSSGDIVYVKDLGILATVNVDGSANDYLIRVDPQTFEGTVIGDTGFIDVFGLGFWGDKVYGFTEENQFILIDVATGEGTEVPVDARRWWGAGVTTRAVVSPE